MDWDAEFDAATLAEIERMEAEALKKEQQLQKRNVSVSPPKPPTPKTFSASSFTLPASRAPPPQSSFHPNHPSSLAPSSIPTVQASPRHLLHPPPTIAPPRQLPASFHTQAGFDQLDELDEPEPGSASVLPANSSSPSRFAVPISAPQAKAPPGPARKTYSGNHDTPSAAPHRNKLVVELAMFSRDRFSLRIPSGWREDVMRTARLVPDARDERDGKHTLVTIPLSAYHSLVDSLRQLPDLALHLFYGPVYDIYIAKKPPVHVDFPPIASKLPKKLNDILLPFQRVGVEFALRRGGRVLIGDEMGLGKTLQALAIAAYYKSDWPVLVIAPSSVRLQWAEHFEEYIPGIRQEGVNVVLSTKGHLNALVNIVSYDLLHRMTQQLSQVSFKVVICDESHFLKGWNTKRTRTVVPLIKRAKHAILLSGTPAISRPRELWQQISALDTPTFGSPEVPWVFYDRYCAAFRDRFGKLNTDGSSNLAELHLLLQDTVMIRRLKSEVLKQLPPKRRTEVKVEISKKFQEAIKLIAAEKELLKMKIDETENWGEAVDMKVDNRGLLIELYKDTGTAKIPAIVEYVTDLCQSGSKFLVFAYHHDVLDALSHALDKEKVEYIRIDGTTPGHHRGQLTEQFQTNPSIQVALLGLTAAGVGLTLHAASTVVFAELYWNPGALLQAEDRAHRIGTTAESVNIYYLIAKNTIDETIWKMISRKLSVLGSALNGTADKLGIDNVEKKETNGAVVDEYLNVLMDGIDTYDERQRAYLQRRADRKQVKEYLRGDRADEQVIAANDYDDDGDDFIEEHPPPKRKLAHVDVDQSSTTSKTARIESSSSTITAAPPAPPAAAAAPPAKAISHALHLFTFNRPGAKPPAAQTTTTTTTTTTTQLENNPPPPPTSPGAAISPLKSPSTVAPPPPQVSTPPRPPLSSSSLSKFAFSRPSSIPPSNPPAVQPQPQCDVVDVSPYFASPTSENRESEEIAVSVYRPKRNKFIADDEL